MSKKKIAIAGAVLASAVAAGVGIAAWSTGGSGDAYAKAGSASSLTLSDASGATSGDLYPGADGALKLRVTNPNSFPVRITTVTLSSGGSITASIAGCNSGGTGVTFTNQSGLALDLAAGATSTFSLAGAVHMSNASADACQGAVFTVPVDVTAISNA